MKNSRSVKTLRNSWRSKVDSLLSISGCSEAWAAPGSPLRRGGVAVDPSYLPTQVEDTVADDRPDELPPAHQGGGMKQVVMLLVGGISSTEYAIEYRETSYSAWSPYMAPIKIVMCFGIALMLLQAVATLFKDIAAALGETL